VIRPTVVIVLVFLNIAAKYGIWIHPQQWRQKYLWKDQDAQEGVNWANSKILAIIKPYTYPISPPYA
jgi:hypothetical protein